MFKRILKAFDIDPTANYQRTPVEIETLYNERFIGQAYTKRPLVIKNHCHQNALSLVDIVSVKLNALHRGIKRLNSYRVTAKNSDYLVELQGRIFPMRLF